jgi:hypothetical protein
MWEKKPPTMALRVGDAEERQSIMLRSHDRIDVAMGLAREGGKSFHALRHREPPLMEDPATLLLLAIVRKVPIMVG